MIIMTWTIEKCPKEDNHPELGDKVQVYLLVAAGEMPMAQIAFNEETLKGVFIVMFPLDDDDTIAAYRMLMDAIYGEGMFMLSQLHSEDTGRPVLSREGDPLLYEFFKEQIID